MLTGFRGDIEFVHSLEDYRGAKSVYWPGGNSGVTLRPGVDLGYADPGLVQDLYLRFLTTQEWRAVQGSFGIRGPSAKQHIRTNRYLRRIKITYEQGTVLFPLAAKPYWDQIIERFPALLAPNVPGGAHTALLSLAYNRGPWNRGLAGLEDNIQNQDWLGLADEIGAMQQNHRVHHVRKRRRMEAQKIRDSAAMLEQVAEEDPDYIAHGLQKMPVKGPKKLLEQGNHDLSPMEPQRPMRLPTLHRRRRYGNRVLRMRDRLRPYRRSDSAVRRQRIRGAGW